MQTNSQNQNRNSIRRVIYLFLSCRWAFSTEWCSLCLSFSSCAIARNDCTVMRNELCLIYRRVMLTLKLWTSSWYSARSYLLLNLISRNTTRVWNSRRCNRKLVCIGEMQESCNISKYCKRWYATFYRVTFVNCNNNNTAIWLKCCIVNSF